MIGALNRSTGGDYELVDPVTETGRTFYWLEDIDFSLETTVRGPARVNVHGDVIASYVATGRTILRVETDQPERVGVRIDGRDTASLALEDSIVFFVPAEGSLINIIVSDEPLRMQTVSADPADQESVVVPLDADGTASFVSEGGVNYFVVGFEGLPVVLDVSDPALPVRILGQEVDSNGTKGVYFELPGGTPVEAGDQ